jgi:uncharacterized protein
MITVAAGNPVGESSESSRARMLAEREHDLFSNWQDVLFVHFEVDPKVLQAEVPFDLHLRDGKAYVSAIGFNLVGLRPKWGGRAGALLMKPIASHELLNVRTYVQHNGETGIYFLAEFLPNLLSLQLGPSMCGLPYRFARLEYQHHPALREICGQGHNAEGRYSYHADAKQDFQLQTCEPGTLDEFLVERYTAFTFRRGLDRYFRVWHPNWSQTPVQVTLDETSLLASTGAWFQTAQIIGGHYSPGFENVWMSWPRNVRPQPQESR